MIVSEVFPGDNNKALKWVQHDLYPRSVAAIFEAARRTMVLADVNRPGFSRHLRAVHYGNHGGGYEQQAVYG